MFLLASFTPCVASAETVAPTGGATAVREYAGTIVFSQFDEASSRWNLALRRAGASSSERLPVASSSAPFQADIGPDSNGRPAVIYRRCSMTTPLSGCDIFSFSLVDGTGERPVEGATHPVYNEIHPTLWRGRIAWVRDYGGVNPVVYTRLLAAVGERPRRLPGVPRRRCGDVEPRCGPTSGRSIEALELRGDRLALIVRYQCAACAGISQTELRLDSASRRTGRPIAFQVSGLSGQALIGPSFHPGRLSWYKTCLAEPSGCRRGGPYRYALATRRYEQGVAGPARVYGFADTGSLLYEVIGCAESSIPFDAACVIDQLTPPTYQATRAPRR